MEAYLRCRHQAATQHEDGVVHEADSPEQRIKQGKTRHVSKVHKCSHPVLLFDPWPHPGA